MTSKNLEVFTEEENALIQQMGLTDVPPAHIKTFLHIAKSMHLDPRLKRDIAMITRNSKNNGPTYTVQVGIAGYRKAARKIAKAEGETIKVDPWLFKGADGDWTDVWDSTGGNYPLAAKCTVYRDDMPFTQVVMWNEFVQQYNGKPQALWASKPTYMLGKTAESLAWRQAFPDEMGNTYEESEVAAIHAEAVDTRGVDAVRQALAAKQQPQQQPKQVEAKQDEPSIFDRAAQAISKATTGDELDRIMAHAHKQGLTDDQLGELTTIAADHAQKEGIE